jgi:hypothetical protein
MSSQEADQPRVLRDLSRPHHIAPFDIDEVHDERHRSRTFYAPVVAYTFPESDQPACQNRIGINQLADLQDTRSFSTARYRLPHLTHFAFGYDLPGLHRNHIGIKKLRQAQRGFTL